LCQFCDGF